MMQTLAQAILCTVAYSDVFDHPLTEEEIHTYLIEVPAPREAVHRALTEYLLPSGRLACREGHFMLPGREEALALRRRRGEFSTRLWPSAARYGRWIGHLPFVRMVAVTGSLAMDSADRQADLDYLIVTRPGRLWLTRALVILLVRLASRRGDTICPNYFLSERALELPQRNLFTAHELAQMVPLAGEEVYRRMWRLNGWVRGYLPNAARRGGGARLSGFYPEKIRPGLEALLQGGLAGRLEQWEMRRKQIRFGRLAHPHPETAFGPDICKGHFDDHGQRILEAYQERLRAMEGVYR
jgi:hypothetical protein